MEACCCSLSRQVRPGQHCDGRYRGHREEEVEGAEHPAPRGQARGRHPPGATLGNILTENRLNTKPGIRN